MIHTKVSLDRQDYKSAKREAAEGYMDPTPPAKSVTYVPGSDHANFHWAFYDQVTTIGARGMPEEPTKRYPT